jgi:hypothetical protein
VAKPKGIYQGGGKGFTEVDADDIGYEPSVPGDWPVPPENVGEALDELAAGGGAGGGSTSFTVIGGVTYPMKQTDGIINLDSSNGSQPVVDLWPTPLTGQSVSLVWSAGNSVLPKYDGNGKLVADYAGGNQVLVANSVISTPGGFTTLKYDGTVWRQVG